MGVEENALDDWTLADLGKQHEFLAQLAANKVLPDLPRFLAARDSFVQDGLPPRSEE
jgi:hypothetical protein